ncbi:MAG: M3 family oligoendopeptidase [Anaerolineales bacterium]|nr:M3 family oligoendopeptidase [Anaerolineales bacterium]
MSTSIDLGPLPHWDLNNVYASLESEPFKKDLKKLEQDIAALKEFMDGADIRSTGAVPEAKKGAVILDEFLNRMNRLRRLSGTLNAYIYSFITTDSYNKTAARILSEFERIEVKLTDLDVRFRGWIGAIDKHEGLLDSYCEHKGAAAEHIFYLKEMAQQSRYLMSEAEEALASELSLSGASAWEKLQGVVTSQIKMPFELDGKTDELPITKIINYRAHPDPDVRKRAYETEMKAWEANREPLAACMNGIKGAALTIYIRRGRESALHRALDIARIDAETLDAMMGAMRDSFPDFRRYWKAKAKLLNQQQLPWWDLMAPLGKTDTVYRYDEARDFILEQFSTFSERMTTFTKRAFSENWIDAEPRDGKVGGAFCMRIPAVDESRILCNFDGSLDQLSTIAHELGHAYHNECRVGKTALQSRTPMTLAETASIFNQTIISDATLLRAQTREEELAILESFLMDSSQVIVDITSRFLFEQEVFERRAKAELSADEFCEIMARCQRETYGDGVDPKFLHPYMWAWKPHYYSLDLPFYNFPYAFGLLFGLGLYAIYQERGDNFLSDYDELLRSTGEGTAADLAQRFGIDLRSRAFWEASIDVIRNRIDRFVAI